MSRIKTIGRLPLVVLVTALAVLSTATIAVAAHTFVDVPNSHPHHANITWLDEKGITKGCNSVPGGFCPGTDVDRGQMATFLKKTADLLTPTMVQDLQHTGVVNLGTTTEWCETADVVIENDGVAYADITLMAQATGGAANAFFTPVISTNGGATWSQAGFHSGNWVSGGATHFESSSIHGTTNVTKGETVRFAMRIVRGFTDLSSNNLSDAWCAVNVTIHNR